MISQLRLPRFFALDEGAVIGFLEDVCTHMSLPYGAGGSGALAHARGFNAYHNFYHAVDVMQTVHAMFYGWGAAHVFTPVEVAATLLGALCHDLEHPGVNNAYLVATRSDLAIRYNDASVLENHHAAVGGALMRKHGLLDGLSAAQHKEFRRIFISAILATDMTTHFSLTEELTHVGLRNTYAILTLLRLEGAPAPEADVSAPDRHVMLKNILHAADLSNPCKAWTLAKNWSDRVLEEFFAQGDRERDAGLPISPNMDRTTTRQAALSLNFIDFVVGPLFVAISAILPQAQVAIDTLGDNRLAWAEVLKTEIEAKTELTKEKKEEEKKAWKRRNTSFGMAQLGQQQLTPR